MRLKIALSSFVLMFSQNLLAGNATGQIGSIINSLWTGDNFVVQLSSGWSGPGCDTNTNSNEPINFVFTPNSSNNESTYNRNYSIAMAAFSSGKTVTLYSANGCDGFGIRIDN